MLKTQKVYLPISVNDSRKPLHKETNTVIEFSSGRSAIYFNIYLNGEFLDNKGGKITHWLEESELVILTQKQAKEIYSKDEVKSMIQSIYSEFAESPLSMHNTYGLKHIIEIEVEGHLIKPIKIFKEK